ncbi:hypothetical protein BwSF12_75350 [Bradyrhizobium ottawaense]|nr:hypothetical protein BwSF12_75350 [Bradyrhizobium ottawaense]GMO93329.1 hypothetical protein BwSF19_73380 [Bradyrhizobium ottawaense]
MWGDTVITIGLRAAPSEVTFAIYDSQVGEMQNVDRIRIPSAFHWPDSLKYVRSNLLDILREYRVERAGIRLTEPNAQSINYERIHIEGVIQEAFASSELTHYFAGAIATIAKHLKVERAAIKLMIEGANTLNVQNWDGMADKEREAVLTAMGAVNV